MNNVDLNLNNVDEKKLSKRHEEEFWEKSTFVGIF
jgi:hypothetical protein